MSSHAPKAAALLAYESGLLSHAGQARLERHLAHCATCRRHRAAMQTYEGIREQVQAEPTPQLDWSRMELGLAREARTQARAQRRRTAGRPVAWALLAAAAVMAAVAMWPEQRTRHAGMPSDSQPKAEPATGADQQAPVPEAPPARGEITTVAGSVELANAEDPFTSGKVGDAVHEGIRLRTGPDSEAHVRLRQGTGVVALEETEITVAKFDPQSVRLELGGGAVTSEVAELEKGHHYEVHAGPWQVHVRGTRFTVAREEAGIAVALEQGSVEVLRSDTRVETLRAPATWSSEGKASELPVRPPRGLQKASRDWPELKLPAVERVGRWRVDGTELPGAGDIALRVPEGQLEVLAHGRHGRVHRIELDTSGREVAELGEAELDRLAARFSRPKQGHIDRDKLTPVLRNTRPVLQRCHERFMRHHPNEGGAYQLRVRVTVGLSGQARHIRVRGKQGPPPDELSQCITHELERRAFPEPEGGPVTFELPLSLQPSVR
jgi:ferric-dicitrate binding protein FerR (iron transport regulator)